MKKSILFVSNYYAPYTSGITEGERLLAEALAKKGYAVKVITSRHDPALAKYEVIHGVNVERCNVQMKISKGTVSIPFLIRVIKESRKYDIVNMQLPMLEAGVLSLFIRKEKLMPMYHCDIHLKNGFLNRWIVRIMDCSHKICLKRSSKIWVTSMDYALHSRVVHRYRAKFIETGGAIKQIHPGTYTKSDCCKIGFCGRIVEEKGIDILIKAFAILQRNGVNAKLLIGGDYKQVAGGSIYQELVWYIKKHRINNIQFLGKIPEEKMGDFYSGLDVFVLPSVNSLEAFGLVQAEAMLCGTPVVASDLYGVRTIVRKTGMGLICKAGDPKSLAMCIQRVYENREKFVKPVSWIQNIFSTEAFIRNIDQCIHTVP